MQWMLGSDVDASYLDEIQVIESLMLVPALAGISTRPCQPARVSYQPAPSQSLASPSRLDWPLDGFYHMVSRNRICNTLVYILVLTDEISLHNPPLSASSSLLQHIHCRFSLLARSPVRFM